MNKRYVQAESYLCLKMVESLLLMKLYVNKKKENL